MIREEIAKKINNWYHHFDREDGFIIADQILALITTEIEKVGNPNVIDTEVGVSPLCSIVANQAFEQCRWTILNLLKEQK